MTELLRVQNLRVERSGQLVLQVDSLSIEEGQRMVVVGPNGSGKSTFLLTLARLLRPSAGQVLWQGQDWWYIPALAYRRKIGLVLQDALLLDTSVYENVALGLRFRHMPEGQIRRRVELWLERLGVTALRDRPANRLSGGEAQRVSLARALALEPQLLLLDEPFGALDAPTRLRLQEDFQSLMQEMALTMVMVTHDLNEALLLGQRMVVVMAGRIVQVGAATEVFGAPVSPEVAELVGVETVLPGQVVGEQDGILSVRCADHVLEVVGQAEIGRSVYVCLRPEDVTLWPVQMHPPSSSARNWLEGSVVRLMPQGVLVRVTLNCAGVTLVALVTRTSAEGLMLQPDALIRASFKASAAHVIAR
jgi:tungstate transport system ATP-binding protein